MHEILAIVGRARCAGVIIAITISNIIELFGLTLLIPIFSLALAGSEGHISRRAEMLLEFERFIGLEQTSSLATLITVYMALLAVKSAIIILVARMNASIVSSITHSVRARIVRSLLQSKWHFFILQRVGGMNRLIFRDANYAGEAFDTAVNYCASLLQLSAYLLVAILISWKLALYLLIIGVTFFFLFARLMQWSKKAAQLHNMDMQKLSAQFVDILTNMKTIKAMALGNGIVESFLRRAEKSENRHQAKVFSADYVRELQEPFIAAAMIMFLLAAIWYEEVVTGGVLVLGLLVVRTSRVFYEVQRLHHRLMVRTINLNNVFQAIARAEWLVEPWYGTRPPKLEKELLVDNVSFQHPRGKSTLENCTLRIPAGTITVLMGPSGAGKTSLLDLILGLYRPNSGKIVVDGAALTGIDLTAWRRSIGYVPQEVGLFNTSIRDNISLGVADVLDDDIWAALMRADAAGFVRELPQGLDHVVGERGANLSGGQRQRIALARALLTKPMIILLDEATSALDPATEKEFCDHLKRLSLEMRLTILSVTHRPYWLEIATNVARMEDGRIVSNEAGHSDGHRR